MRWRRRTRPVSGVRNNLHGILDSMRKRLAALLIALAIGAAPLALEVCQLTCALDSMHSDVAQPGGAHVMHPGGDGSEPWCHEAGEAAHTLSRGSAPCDHHDPAIASSLVTTRPDTVAAAPVHMVVFDLGNTARACIADRGRAVLAVTRLELRLSAPLRI